MLGRIIFCFRRWSAVLRLAKFLGFLEFPLGWVFALGLDLICKIWVPRSGLVFPPLWWDCLGYFLGFLVIKGLYLGLLRANVAWAVRAASSLKFFFLGGEYILLGRSLGTSLCVLSYLCCTWNFPLVDQELSRIDHAIGGDWAWFFHWSFSGGWLSAVLQHAYDSLVLQLVFFSIWFASRYEKARLYETFWIFFCSLFLTVLISGFLPALGPASALGVVSEYAQGHLQDIASVVSIRTALSSGVVIANLGGIVVFPSFHTVAAIIYMYAFRQSGVVGYLALLLNCAMLVSIPAFGDHYFTDMIVGAAIAGTSILAMRAFFGARQAQS